MPVTFRNSETQYGHGGRILHWTSVALLLTLILTANDFDDLEQGVERAELIRTHASWGLLFLLVMSLRLYWRLSNINPVNSYSIHGWQKFSAKFLHWSIYFIVISQSLVGIVNILGAGHGIPFFDLFELPPVMEKSELLYEVSRTVHYVISIVIYPLFAIHISAAIYHQLFGVLDDV